MKVDVKNLSVSIEGKKILNDVSMSFEEGQLTIVMGPNGSGKSTVSNVIMGHPSYDVDGGEVIVEGENILELEPHERARKGIFMSFQYPVEIPGLTVGRFLRRSYEVLHGEVPKNFVALLRKEVEELGLSQDFINRYLNEGFSGGEKKRMEVLQLKILKPRFAILDEIDSGLDIDAIRIIAGAINDIRRENPAFSLMLVTHYRRIVDELENSNKVYVLSKGKIVSVGELSILDKLEGQGYRWLEEGGVQ